MEYLRVPAKHQPDAIYTITYIYFKFERDAVAASRAFGAFSECIKAGGKKFCKNPGIYILNVQILNDMVNSKKHGAFSVWSLYLNENFLKGK